MYALLQGRNQLSVLGGRASKFPTKFYFTVTMTKKVLLKYFAVTFKKCPTILSHNFAKKIPKVPSWMGGAPTQTPPGYATALL